MGTFCFGNNSRK